MSDRAVAVVVSRLESHGRGLERAAGAALGSQQEAPRDVCTVYLACGPSGKGVQTQRTRNPNVPLTRDVGMTAEPCILRCSMKSPADVCK